MGKMSAGARGLAALMTIVISCQICMPGRAEAQLQPSPILVATPVATTPLTAFLVLSGDASGKTIVVPDASQPKNRQWQIPVNLKELAEASLLSDMHQRFANVQGLPNLESIPKGFADLIFIVNVSESSYITHYSFGFSPGTGTISSLVNFTAVAKSGAQFSKTVAVQSVVSLPKPYAIGPMDFAQIPALFKAKLEEAFIGFLNSPETYALIGNLNVTASQPYSGPKNGEHLAAGTNNNGAPPDDLVGTTQESPAQAPPVLPSAQSQPSAKTGDAHYCVKIDSRYNGGPVPFGMALRNTCNQAIAIAFCAQLNSESNSWRCGVVGADPGLMSQDMETWGCYCASKSCSEWVVEWNAVFNLPGAQSPVSPEHNSAKAAH
jgi:hypothetical protein